MVNVNVISALNQISNDRGIDISIVIDVMKQCIIDNFNDLGEYDNNVSVLVNDKTGEIRVIASKKIVNDNAVSNIYQEIAESNAKMINMNKEIGEFIDVDITKDAESGRIMAQAMRTSFYQKLAEVEKETVLMQLVGQIGTVQLGIVQKATKESIYVEVKKAIGIISSEDKIQGEFYKPGDKIKVYLKDIVDTDSGKMLELSRSDPEFVTSLFRQEVPEIASDSVIIKALAREAGSRSKIAVYSMVDGIDPIGACVGQRGVRINAVRDALKYNDSDEKIDIILWDKDKARFIANSLSPATVSSIALNESEDEALIVVPDDQLSLAIGKEGQNARLAARLTDTRIKIISETEEKDEVDSDSTEASLSTDSVLPVNDNLQVSEGGQEDAAAVSA